MRKEIIRNLVAISGALGLAGTLFYLSQRGIGNNYALTKRVSNGSITLFEYNLYCLGFKGREYDIFHANTYSDIDGDGKVDSIILYDTSGISKPKNATFFYNNKMPWESRLFFPEASSKNVVFLERTDSSNEEVFEKADKLMEYLLRIANRTKPTAENDYEIQWGKVSGVR